MKKSPFNLICRYRDNRFYWNSDSDYCCIIRKTVKRFSGLFNNDILMTGFCHRKYKMIYVTIAFNFIFCLIQKQTFANIIYSVRSCEERMRRQYYNIENLEIESIVSLFRFQTRHATASASVSQQTVVAVLYVILLTFHRYDCFGWKHFLKSFKTKLN